MDQLPRLGKRELICLLLFTCNYVLFFSERFPLPLGAWDGHVVSSPEPKVHRCAYRILMVPRQSVIRPSSSSFRRQQCPKIFFSNTTRPIKAKFYVESPWVGERNFVRGIWVT